MRLIRRSSSLVLRAPEGDPADGGTGGGSGGSGGAPPPPAGGAPAPDPKQHTLTDAQFDERMQRATRSHMRKQFGVESDDELKAQLDDYRKIKADKEAAERAQMTEIDRLKLEAKERDEKFSALEQRLHSEAFDRNVTRACMTNGIANVDYATFEIMRKTESLGDGESLDLDAYLKELAADPLRAAALGVKPPPEKVERPVDRAPGAPPAPAPPAPGGSGGEAKTAFELSPAEWRAKKSQLGMV